MKNDRTIATRRVMKTLARYVSMRSLPIRLADGTSPVVVALPGDSVESLVEQIRTAGGQANVLVAFPEHIMLVGLGDAASTQPIQDYAEVHRLSDVGMLLEWMKTLPESGGAFNVHSDENPHRRPSVREMDYVF